MINLLLTLFIPLLYFLPVAIVLHTQTIIGFGSVPLVLLGILIAYTGIFFWFTGFIKLGWKNLTVLPKARSLIKTGVYKYFRHPIYLGTTLTFTGLSLCLGSWPGLFYTILVIIPLNILRARNEEKLLIKEFRGKYIKYQKKTLL
jgi:protein-S-isoprenylcysteine O-methyltransferase Ste14